ncbi:MAG: S9 family peptidase [Planctomycetota bacterium]
MNHAVLAYNRTRVPCSRKVQYAGLLRSGPVLPALVALLVALQIPLSACGAEPTLLQLDDLYRCDRVTHLTLIADAKSAIYCRQWIDPDKRAYRYALWQVDGEAENRRPLEEGQPDARQPMLSPDGRRVLFLSTRPLPDGTPAFTPVPPYSDPATDVWLIPVTGGKAIPLGGKGKPYGRIFSDRFYGNIAFSPDGKRLVFVADDGRDRRTPEEIEAGVSVVREDQGEGYTGYGPAQIWVVELADDNAARLQEVERRLTPRSLAPMHNRLRAPDRVIRWKSFDGLEIEGILTAPPEQVAQPPYKLIVHPHGGPHHRASGGSSFAVQLFAANGYAVFQPNFRGSTGYGPKFLDADRSDFGGGDMRDILTGIDYLVAEGIVDADRQFVYGVSYGGYMTSWLVGHTSQFRAAVAQNAVTDLNAMWHLSDLQSWTEWEFGGLPWEVPEAMHKHSPLSYASDVRTPTLILHSANDRRCPLAMGTMFYRALKRHGVETQMVIYHDEGHPIKQLSHQRDVLRRVLDWFQLHD